jgi:hypothetical protein
VTHHQDLQAERALVWADGSEDPLQPQTREEQVMTGFVQIIEMQTSRIDEVEALIRELRNRLDDGGSSSAPRRGVITADRDRPGFYLSVVQFESYEAAMENSNRPEVSEYADRMAKLCDAAPKFYNLDVRETWQPSTH